jgi:hypothetical protein
MNMEIPAFLLRSSKPGVPPMSPAPITDAKPAKTRRKDAYCATVKVKIPLDMLNADSLATAIKAVAGIKDHLPEGATVESVASLGKM